MSWAAREPTHLSLHTSAWSEAALCKPLAHLSLNETSQAMNKRTPISSRGAKVRWLQAHPVLWQDFLPDDHQNWRDIVRLMKADGLISQSTYALDVSLPSLIADAHSH
jgi:hypothetical protein